MATKDIVDSLGVQFRRFTGAWCRVDGDRTSGSTGDTVGPKDVDQDPLGAGRREDGDWLCGVCGVYSSGCGGSRYHECFVSGSV